MRGAAYISTRSTLTPHGSVASSRQDCKQTLLTYRRQIHTVCISVCIMDQNKRSAQCKEHLQSFTTVCCLAFCLIQFMSFSDMNNKTGQLVKIMKWSRSWNGQSYEMVKVMKWSRSWTGQGHELVKVMNWSRSWTGQGHELVTVRNWSRSETGQGHELVKVMNWSRSWTGQGHELRGCKPLSLH